MASSGPAFPVFLRLPPPGGPQKLPLGKGGVEDAWGMSAYTSWCLQENDSIKIENYVDNLLFSKIQVQAILDLRKIYSLNLKTGCLEKKCPM